MILGYDAKRITHNKTGLGNYSRFVVNGLASCFPGNTHYLYTPGEGDESLRKQVEHPNACFRYPQGIYRLCPSFWRSGHMPADLKRDGVEVFHGLSNELPMGINRSGIPSVVTLHDLIFLRYPQLYAPIDRQIYRYKFRQACLHADRIVAVSRQTKEDAVSFFHIKEEKIAVVYQGCSPSFYHPVPDDRQQEVREKYGITTPYILYVGSMEKRKNLLSAVKALRRLDTGIALIAIGRRTSYMDSVEAYIREQGLGGRVRLLTGVPFADLPAFYRMAALFVYPSFFEGFGIPVLEALASGTPVVAASGSCLEEAGGPGSLYADPSDEAGLADLMKQVLDNPRLADAMRRQGKAYAGRFAPGILASEMMKVYQDVL
ncbi:MAG: glycosyltransferase family 4 protein [Tannerellaceae bacterium]|jgi:glycosyltransferase involved in cell wall biosynthesis|nr:glycosyltransferase family 4 protein [Tannerellaceae bacterium]